MLFFVSFYSFEAIDQGSSRLLVASVGNLKYLLTWSTLLQFVYLSLENLRKFLSMFVKVSKASNKNKNWQDIRNQNQETYFPPKSQTGVLALSIKK